MILHDFLDACTRFDSGALERVLHPDARISEMPNLVNRGGTERDRAAALAAFARGRKLLSAQSFAVHCSVVAGDTIAARSTWRGTLAATGQELTAHIASFTQVRDGRVYRHATYDCYEPFATTANGS
jgi:ketosteroid isomerase-like protein